MPSLVCTSAPFTNLSSLFGFVTCFLVKIIVPFLFALATVAFIWGVVQMILNPENEEKRKAGKQFMIWGIIGLFVMLMMWSLVGVLSSTFGLTTFIPQLSQ